jgi:hypothetical protein
MSRRIRLLCAVAACLAWGAAARPAAALSTLIDFDDLGVGEIVSTQYLASHGVSISATHLSGGPDAAITFDSLGNSGYDWDLEGPDWASGNLSDQVLGNILIVPENVDDGDGDGLVDFPDDEGTRPAGILSFVFQTPVTEFGLDLIDVEPPDEMGYLAFFDAEGLVGEVSFEDLATADASVVYGDRSANRIAPIAASAFEAASFVEVQVHLGGSSAVDNIRFAPISEVPEPATGLLLGLGLVGLGARRSRRAGA